MLDEETDPLDPTEQIQEWLENSEVIIMCITRVYSSFLCSLSYA